MGTPEIVMLHDDAPRSFSKQIGHLEDKTKFNLFLMMPPFQNVIILFMNVKIIVNSWLFFNQ